MVLWTATITETSGPSPAGFVAAATRLPPVPVGTYAVIRSARHELFVRLDDFLGRAVHADHAALQPYRAVADLANGADRVADQEHRTGTGEHLAYPVLATSAESRVAGRECLVDKQDVVHAGGRDGEPE